MATIRVSQISERRLRARLYISIALFLYFTSLLVLNHYRLDAVMIGVLREILTIPAVLSVLFLLVQSAIGFYKEHYRIGSLSFYALLISCITIAELIVFA